MSSQKCCHNSHGGGGSFGSGHSHGSHGSHGLPSGHSHGPPIPGQGGEEGEIGPKMLFACVIGVLIDSFTSSLALCSLPFYVLRLTKKSDEGLESAWDVGFVIGICFLLQILVGPLILRFSFLYGRRIAFLSTSIASVASFYILSQPVDLNTLIIGRCIGAFSASFIPLSQFYLGDMTPPQLRSQAMMTLGGAYALGTMMGPFAAWYFDLSFIPACNAAFFLSTFNFMIVYFFMLESLPSHKLDRSSSLFSFYPRLPSPPSISIHLMVFLCRFLSGIFLSSFEIFGPLLMHYQFGFSPSFSVLLLSLFTGLYSLLQSSPLLSFLSRVSNEKISLYISLGLSILSSPFTLSSSPLFPSYPLTILSLIPFSMSVCISQPILSSYLAKSTSPQEAPSFTLFFSALSRAFSALLGGAWLSSSSSPEETVLWLVFLSALSLPCAFFMPYLTSLTRKTTQPDV